MLNQVDPRAVDRPSVPGSIDHEITFTPREVNRSENPLIEPWLVEEFLLGSDSINRVNPVPDIDFFGRQLKDNEWAALAGAPAGTTVSLKYFQNSGPSGGPYILADVKGTYIAEKDALIYRSDKGELCRIGTVVLDPETPRGYGTLSMAVATWQAIQLGMDKLSGDASRRNPKNPQSLYTDGYSVWPNMGFDCEVPASVRTIIPEKFKGADTLLDLYELGSEAREWWREHGVTIDVEFDLHPGSRSRSVLRRYLVSKGLDLPFLKEL